MKNALLRRKTRRKTGRPHKQPSPATTWQPTWLFSVAVLVALCACLILNCQEFTTHQHLSDIEEWIGHAYTHFTVNDAARIIVLLRAMYGTLRCAARWKHWNFPRRTSLQASNTAPEKSRPADLGDYGVHHGSYPYGASHTLASGIIALLIGYVTYAALNTHDAWGSAVLSGWMANDLLGTRTMWQLAVRLVGYSAKRRLQYIRRLPRSRSAQQEAPTVRLATSRLLLQSQHSTQALDACWLTSGVSPCNLSPGCPPPWQLASTAAYDCYI